MDHWVEEQICALSPERLAGIAHGVSAHHGLDVHAVLVAPMIPPGGVAVPLAARTAEAALRAWWTWPVRRDWCTTASA